MRELFSYLFDAVVRRRRVVCAGAVAAAELIQVEARTSLVTVYGARLERYAAVGRRRRTVVQKHVSVAVQRLQRLGQTDGLR